MNAEQTFYAENSITESAIATVKEVPHSKFEKLKSFFEIFSRIKSRLMYRLPPHAGGDPSVDTTVNFEKLNELRWSDGSIVEQLKLKSQVVLMKALLRIAREPVQTWQKIIRCILVICLASCGARLFWLIIPAPQIPPASLNLIASPAATPTSEFNINLQQLKSLNLFGKSVSNNLEQNADLNPSGVTQLNLSLVGVMESNIEEYGRAIIIDGNHPEVYAVGAQLPGGNDIRLMKVMNDSVIINNQGNLEVLYLYSDAPHKQQNFVAASSPSHHENSMAQAYDNPQEETPPAPQRPQLNYPAQAITAIERGTSAVANLATVNENGKMQGFKVSQGADGERFKALGLQPGDVIVGINGWPANSPEKMLEMYQNLGDRTSISVDIKRGKNIVSAEIPLQ